ncbi:hypothetical protein FQR65_LT20335 [Abscondita terminalis]|nr:hypothetical protein FQR65_LT20335 [Abscondita terminalis]
MSLATNGEPVKGGTLMHAWASILPTDNPERRRAGQKLLEKDSDGHLFRRSAVRTSSRPQPASAVRVYGDISIRTIQAVLEPHLADNGRGDESMTMMTMTKTATAVPAVQSTTSVYEESMKSFYPQLDTAATRCAAAAEPPDRVTKAIIKVQRPAADCCQHSGQESNEVLMYHEFLWDVSELIGELREEFSRLLILCGVCKASNREVEFGYRGGVHDAIW